MGETILLATDDGIALFRFEDGRFTELLRTLSGIALTSVGRPKNAFLAGTRTGILRSTNGGGSWTEAAAGPVTPHIRWLLVHPDRTDLVFAGTEPAGIFVSDDAGLTWTGRPEVERLRDEHGWWLPYSPESGCVRGLAFHGERGYAAVEVGGVLRTLDGGATWDLAPGSSGDPQFRDPPPDHVHADVHSVEVHPSSADLAFAATNAGLYRSRDAGETWMRINADGYTRAVWLDPGDPEHFISGPARSVGRNGTVIETRDGGMTWGALTDGLQSPWPNTMVERFCAIGPDHLAAVLDDGRMTILNRRTGRWGPGPDNPGVVRGIAL
ncbi:MAG TPA: hypothetical protein VMN57_07220 [Anaerolineales bacterium]|nr:hypothetical protein [Anaerolineales bacterium]